MEDINIRIQELDKTVCDNIELIGFASRGLISQNILSQSRNLVEHMAMKAYSLEHNLTVDYPDLKSSLEYIKTDDKYLFLREFHLLLQESRSHYGSSHEGAERLALKYYKYFVMLRNFAKKEYNMEILNNLNKFPVNTDKTIQEYYEKIAEVLKIKRPLVEYSRSERFYVKKVKSFVVDGKVYYENTLTPAGDNVSKMDRFIAFSRKMIPYHYAINALVFMDKIEIRNKNMPVNILGDFRVSIRPCELNNFAKLFGIRIKMTSNSAEYIGMMNYLTKSGASLTDIALMSEKTYKSIREAMIARAKTINFIPVLDMCRQVILKKGHASNVLAYLLATLNNRVLKLQYYNEQNKRLAGMFLKWGCIPFDDMPFASSLIKHTPEPSELFGCISVEGREHELMGRYIQNNTKINGRIYTKVEEVESYGDVDVLINRYNSKIYSGHQGRKIHKFGKNKLYIEDDVKNTEFIIRKLMKISEKGVAGYEESVVAWMTENENVDSEEKKEILKNMFSKSQIAIIYGAEAIEFGNWFELAKHFLKKEAWCELETPYRTKKDDLLLLWKKVRNLDADITEHIVHHRYSTSLDETIFEKKSDDEIILCLNYDGLYGINNINRFLQNNNSNPAYKIGVWVYKVGDPILFNETERFAPVLYNNLKGKIVQIEPTDNGVFFSIEINTAITEWDADDVGLDLLDPIHPGKSVVRFFVSNKTNTDEDGQDIETIVPFQVSYAVSIHKAQGLEYDSVKVVITEEVDEMISL